MSVEVNPITNQPSLSDEELNAWFLTQGYDPNDVEYTDYVQKTDDCDWVF